MFLMKKRVVEGNEEGESCIWFLFGELNSELACLFPRMSEGKCILVIISRFSYTNSHTDFP